MLPALFEQYVNYGGLVDVPIYEDYAEYVNNESVEDWTGAPDDMETELLSESDYCYFPSLRPQSLLSSLFAEYTVDVFWLAFFQPAPASLTITQRYGIDAVRSTNRTYVNDIFTIGKYKEPQQLVTHPGAILTISPYPYDPIDEDAYRQKYFQNYRATQLKLCGR